MWKALLFCDACKTAVVEGQDQGSRTVTYKAKQAALAAGWIREGANGHQPAMWKCAQCQATNPSVWVPKAGDVITYTGNIITADNVLLKGMRAVAMQTPNLQFGTVTVIFIDAEAGPYRERQHNFFINEFKPFGHGA